VELSLIVALDDVVHLDIEVDHVVRILARIRGKEDDVLVGRVGLIVQDVEGEETEVAVRQVLQGIDIAEFGAVVSPGLEIGNAGKRHVHDRNR
jgi:hypothetical protein